ncbi:MAG: AtpZ/AtpI family protein [Nocardioides sp.]
MAASVSDGMEDPPDLPEIPDEAPRGDPWHAFGYLVAGVVLYGGAGWLLDRWFGTSFLVVIGILVGSGLGIYQTWARFRALPISAVPQQQKSPGNDRDAGDDVSQQDGSDDNEQRPRRGSGE